jgi:hypothetical protein
LDDFEAWQARRDAGSYLTLTIAQLQRAQIEPEVIDRLLAIKADLIGHPRARQE